MKERLMVTLKDMYAVVKWPFAPLCVPIIDWLPTCSRATLLNDSIAGVTVFILLIPSGMAYSVLAGMPPVYGLYTVTAPMFIYICDTRHI